MALNNGGGGGGGGGSAKDVRAGGAFWEFFGKDKVTGLLDRIRKKFNAVAGGLAKAGALGGAAGSALLAPLTALFTAGVDRAADMQRTADSLGMPIEQLSRLQYAADQAKVSLDEVMKDPGRFGKLIAEAPVIDEATGRKALEVQQEMTRATIALKDAMLPLLDVVLPVAKGFGALAKEAGPVLLLAAGAGAALVALGLAAGGASALVAGLGAAVGVAKVAFLALLAVAQAGVAALLTPVGLLAAAVAGVGYLLATQTETGRAWTAEVGGNVAAAFAGAFGSVRAGLTGLAETAKAAGGGIRDALAAGDLGLAWKIGLAGLSLEWAKFTAFLTGKWNGFKGFFVDGWHDAVKLLKLGWNDFDHWIGTAIIDLMKFLNEQFGEGLRTVFGWVAKAFDALGRKADADAFRTIAGSSTEQLARALEGTQRGADAARDANVDRIEREAGAEQAARDAARAADLAGANADVARAAADLARLVEEAAAAAARQRPGAAIPPPAAAQLGRVTVRGVFAGPLGQQLGAGSSFQKQQLDVLKAIRDGVGELVRNAVNLSFK